MPERVTKLQVFIASPGDVEPERDVVEHVVREINVTVARQLKLVLEPVRWETHVRPGVGVDAQDVVNRQIEPEDIFIGILWSRLGTPTKRARSGTVEEFERALEARQRNALLEVMVYFKTAAPAPGDDGDAARDVEEVREFRQRIQSQGITVEFDTLSEFESKIRSDLTQLIMEWKAHPIPASRATAGREAAGRPVVLFAEGLGQREWWNGAATVADGYKRISEITAARGCVVQSLSGHITPPALRGAACLVFPIGPSGRSRLEAPALRTIHQFVADGNALLLLCNYAGQQHHQGNLNDLAVRYGLTFEADAVTPRGYDDRAARRQHAATPRGGCDVTARPANTVETDGESVLRVRAALTRNVRRIITLTPCSITPRSDAAGVVMSDPEFDVLEARYTRWSSLVDEWVPTSRHGVPVVAASSVARVAAVGGWKTFLNTFVEDKGFDNAQLWENLIDWLCRRD